MDKEISMRYKQNTGYFMIMNDSLKVTNMIRDNFKP
jgi:hypothetical protein